MCECECEHTLTDEGEPNHLPPRNECYGNWNEKECNLCSIFSLAPSLLDSIPRPALSRTTQLSPRHRVAHFEEKFSRIKVKKEEEYKSMQLRPRNLDTR